MPAQSLLLAIAYRFNTRILLTSSYDQHVKLFHGSTRLYERQLPRLPLAAVDKRHEAMYLWLWVAEKGDFGSGFRPPPSTAPQPTTLGPVWHLPIDGRTTITPLNL
jgi:hypothetical protein